PNSWRCGANFLAKSKVCLGRCKARRPALRETNTCDSLLLWRRCYSTETEAEEDEDSFSCYTESM
ncbi:unnamed protein product, partial [Linum tenue]